MRLRAATGMGAAGSLPAAGEAEGLRRELAEFKARSEALDALAAALARNEEGSPERERALSFKSMSVRDSLNLVLSDEASPKKRFSTMRSSRACKRTCMRSMSSS